MSNAEGKIKGPLLTQEGSSTIDFHGIRLPCTSEDLVPFPLTEWANNSVSIALSFPQPLWHLYSTLSEELLYLWDLPIVPLKTLDFLSNMNQTGLSIVIIPEDHVTCQYSEQSRVKTNYLNSHYLDTEGTLVKEEEKIRMCRERLLPQKLINCKDKTS